MIFVLTYLLSFCVMVPLSSLPAIDANTLLASLAKSKSRTSAGGTGTIAKASLSSLTADVPIWENHFIFFFLSVKKAPPHPDLVINYSPAT